MRLKVCAVQIAAVCLVLGLGATAWAQQFCLAVADLGDQLSRIDTSDFDPATNETDIGQGLGVSSVETICLNSDTGVLFAIDSDQVGTINLETGRFSALPEDMGRGRGEEGRIDFDDSDAMAYDPTSGTLYAAVGQSGNDLLIQIDQQTGERVANAFGNRVDYVLIGGFGDGESVDDMAVDPTNGDLYAVSQDTAVIARINKETGEVISSIDLSLDVDIEGLAFDLSGQMWGSGQDSDGDKLWRIDKVSGEMDAGRVLDNNGDYEGIACLTPRLVADLALTVSGDEGLVFEEDLLTWTVEISNPGDITMPGVALVYEPPSPFELQDHSTSIGTWDEDTGLWLIGDLDPGASATLRFEVLVPRRSAILDVTTTVTLNYQGPPTDENPGNNSGTLNFRIELDPDADPDRDGLVNSEEAQIDTDPYNPDTDGDSLLDGDEVGDVDDPTDTDDDGLIDPLDPDDDNDGIDTRVEVEDSDELGDDDVDDDGNLNWLDPNADAEGAEDGVEGRGDEDNDGVPDYLDPDMPVDPFVDLSLTIMGPEGPVFEETEIEWVLTLTNNGNTAATGASVRHALPDGLVIESAVASDGSFDEDEGLWSVGSVPPGASVTLTIRARVERRTEGQTMVVEGESVYEGMPADNNPGNDSVELSFDVALDPDADPDEDGLVNSEERAIDTDPYNPDTDGDSLLDGDEVGDVNDPTDTDDDGLINPLDPDDDNDGIDTRVEVEDSDELGDDDVDGEGDVNWLDSDADGDGVNDGAEGRGDVDDDGIINYLDPDDPFIESVDLALTMSPTPESVFEEEVVTWVLTVRNFGSAEARDISVAHLIPESFVLESAEASGGSFIDTVGVWEIDALGPEASHTLDIQVRVARRTDGETITVRAEVRHETGPADQSLDNNSVARVFDVTLDPDADPDNDGLANRDEILVGTDPYDPDTDGDSLLDGDEVGDVDNPTDTDDDGLIDPLDPDDDGDGIDTLIEIEDSVDLGDDDADDDGDINWLDPDADDDGLTDGIDGRDDQDGDGTPNYLDPDMGDEADTDGDGVPDSEDNCPGDENPDQLDTDGDNIGDACDEDSDNLPEGNDLVGPFAIQGSACLCAQLPASTPTAPVWLFFVGLVAIGWRRLR